MPQSRTAGVVSLDLISSTDIYMYCDTTDVTASPSTTPTVPVPMTTGQLPSATHSVSIPMVTATPPTATPTPELCPPQKEEMCSSLETLKNKTVSSDGTSGSCHVSNDCVNMTCDLTVTYSGFNVPVSVVTTLLPCSTPYAVHLYVHSTLGDLINGIFTESKTVPINILGSRVNVIVNITQHCYGITLAVSYCC